MSALAEFLRSLYFGVFFYLDIIVFESVGIRKYQMKQDHNLIPVIKNALETSA
jgi:hypothetical protein